MTIYDVLRTAYRQPLMTVCLILLALQAYLFTASMQSGRSRRLTILSFLHLLTGFVFFHFAIGNQTTILHDLNADELLPPVMKAFGSLPVYVMILYEIMSALILLIVFHDLIRCRRDYPASESIKETMDLLPAGIAFTEDDGTFVFRNLVMNDILRKLSEQDQAELKVFADMPQNGKEFETQISFPDGSAWQISAEETECGGEPYIELIATDITEQTKVTRELEEKNKKLREIHMRLDIYNKQAARIIIAQELLNARMAVHNEAGSVLLESRRYLNDPASYDEELLLGALKNTNTYLLHEYEEDDTGRDHLKDALETADTIGVDTVITGIIPQEDPERMILAAAISECASNTVKHADGDSLFVHIASTDAETVIELCNNGDQPQDTVKESGGLLSLRTLVEKEGGSMEISSAGGFRLVIRLFRS